MLHISLQPSSFTDYFERRTSLSQTDRWPTLSQTSLLVIPQHWHVYMRTCTNQNSANIKSSASSISLQIDNKCNLHAQHNRQQANQTCIMHQVQMYYLYYRYTHMFNGPLSRTTRVGWYQKDKTNLDFTEARDSEWQWHQLGHKQVCISLQIPDR